MGKAARERIGGASRCRTSTIQGELLWRVSEERMLAVIAKWQGKGELSASSSRGCLLKWLRLRSALCIVLFHGENVYSNDH